MQITNVDWSPDDAFTLAIIVDTILAMVVITNCITFYPRMRSGPKFMKRQIFLIAFSGIFMLCRDMLIVSLRLKSNESIILSVIFSILYIFTNTVMYWLFAFKYWTVSLDFDSLDTATESVKEDLEVDNKEGLL